MEKFFNPQSVALIGVPRQTGPGSFNNLENLLRFGYTGKIYPVNPKAEQICGIHSFPSVLEIPDQPDLAVISVGRDRVPLIFDQCSEKGIKRLVIVSQGFADGDQRGKQLQEELVTKAKQRNIRIIGPNTLGLYDLHANFTTSFMDLAKPPAPAPIALIAQTGLFMVASKTFSTRYFAKTVDLGNACDVDVSDVLEYFENDPQIEVIALHLEGIHRGKNFVETASRVSKTKPIIALKSGKSDAGARAALSHTGTLVGNDDIYNAAFERAGVIRVRDSVELQDAIKALSTLSAINGPNIGAITFSGALCIMVIDACEDAGLKLGGVPSDLRPNLLNGMPKWVHLKNPLDIWPIGMIRGNIPEIFETAFSALLDDEEIHGIVGAWFASDSPLLNDVNFYDSIVQLYKKSETTKPIALWIYGDGSEKAIQEREKIPGVACFPTIERCIRGLAFNHRYHSQRQKTAQTNPSIEIDRVCRDKVAAKGKNEKIVVGQDAFDLLRAYGISVVSGKAVKDIEEALGIAGSFGYPVVCKIGSKDILHKTEAGAIEMNIFDPAHLRSVYHRLALLLKNHGGDEDSQKIIIQKQMAGVEVLLGLKQDPQFGMVLVCGQGGIYTEVYKDIVHALVPVCLAEAHRMLEKLRFYPILKGVRGTNGVNIGQLADTMVRLSIMAEDVDELTEADINPFIASPNGSWAVDARFIW
ncbi:acetate--CoA ligase family protein [Thermodesulfobacteriota bacterium]